MSRQVSNDHRHVSFAPLASFFSSGHEEMIDTVRMSHSVSAIYQPTSPMDEQVSTFARALSDKRCCLFKEFEQCFVFAPFAAPSRSRTHTPLQMGCAGRSCYPVQSHRFTHQLSHVLVRPSHLRALPTTLTITHQQSGIVNLQASH